MRKHVSLLLLFLVLTLQLSAQITPEKMGGVYYAYPSPSKVFEAPVPEGYSLVYLSHYGRHGSRWLTSDDRYEWVLDKFNDDSNLTRQGRKAKKLLQKVYANARGNGGKLTPVGERQHAGIARRMIERFPTIFNHSPQVSARSSVAGRCRKSMEAFVAELNDASDASLRKKEKGIKNKFANSNFKIQSSKFKVQSSTDSADMRWMSCDSPDEKLLQKETNVPLEISSDRFIANLFKDPSKVEDRDKLLSEMFTIASDMQDVDGINVSLYSFFTQEEMLACYEQSCKKMWHQNGLDPTNHGIPAQCAANLWGNIVIEADKALASDRPSVTLRFGHDTALYRLLSLLGSKTVAQDNGMNLYDIVPMAANLQMAFYKDKRDSVLVAFWLNEKQMEIVGGQTFYSWQWLKDKYAHYLETQRWKDRVDGVNTMVGTAFAVTRSVGVYGKGSEEHGQTIPAVLAPHGMNFWTPQTRDTEQKCIAPYYYPDSLFQGFRASHWLVGGCTQDYGSFTLMPEMGKLRLLPEERATRFSHTSEESHPYYYKVYLPDEHLTAEMTATSRAAMFRFTPDEDDVMHIVVNPNSDYKEGFVTVDTIRNIIYGYNPVHRIYQGWGEKAGFSGWFVVEINASLKAKLKEGIIKNKLTGNDFALRIQNNDSISVASVSLPVKSGEPVLVRCATSFTSLDAALANLRAEMPTWDFLGYRLALDSVWRRKLATIDIEDDDRGKVNEFYGALYRAYFLPHALSDVDGSHPKFGSGVTVAYDSNHKHQNYYDDFSMWDIYRAQLPLLTIIEPERMSDIMQSLVTKYEEGGWMPIFPCWNSYTAAMIGDHASAALADAWVKGIRGFDVKKAYEGVRKNAFESPKTFAEYKDGMGRRALKSYLKYGYIPLEDSVMEAFHTHEQVSRTLEYAYDDFCAAQLAKAVGNESDYKELMRRSSNWKNVFNPAIGWVDGRYASLKNKEERKKNKSGSWLRNTDLTSRMPFITEGAVMHYSFYVPQDVDGLMTVMGGKEKFIAKLDTLFGLTPLEFRDGTWPSTVNRGKVYYWHGNEPCHQIAYLYALAGQPWKTQWLVQDILKSEYMDVPGGLSGNDDAGQMSAWYVFSSIGFYPVCPGKAEYVLGTPSFKKAKIGNLTIEAENLSADNPFIESMTWNGKPYQSYKITHDMITSGGTLRIKLKNRFALMQ